MTDGTPRAACWLRPEQTGVVSRVLDAAGIRPITAGAPEPSQTGRVANDLGCEPCDDLRAALTSSDPDLVLIASPGEFGESDLDQDLGALQQARARAVPVATLEPVPASAMSLSGTRWAEALENGSLAESIRFAPRTRRTPAIDELNALLETFGVPRSGAIRMHAPNTLGSLGARLFDAMDLTRALFGVPESIDACCVTPTNGRGLHQLPGDTLRSLEGDLTVHLRFPDGRSLSAHLSDRAPSSSFDLRLIGAEGIVDVNHERLTWLHTSGESDETVIKGPDDGARDFCEAALITQLKQLCSGVGPTHAPIDYSGVLSMTHAALLSCRTGQGESPDTIRRLMQSA
ncbi:MAG: hypothetical protein AAGA55_02795 [Planctomycetota bacterium]